MNRARVYLWIGFALSLLVTVICSLDLSFNVIALPLKETFDFTQTQVELTASASSLGAMFGFLGMVFQDRLGYRRSALLFWFLAVSGSGLYAVETYYSQAIRQWPILVYAVQTLLSWSLGMIYIFVSAICIQRFPRQHLAKVVASYFSAFCFGKIYYASLSEFLFSDELSQFFLCIFITAVVILGLCFWVLNEVIESEELCSGTEYEEFPKEDADDSAESMSPVQILKKTHFHAIFWSSVIFLSLTTTLLKNITSVAKSAKIYDPLLTVFLISIVIIVVRLLFGAVFDKLKYDLVGFAMLFFGYACYMTCALIGLFALNNRTVLVMSVLIGIAHGVGLPIPISMIARDYGRSYYSAITNALFTLSGILVISLQVLMGYFYDNETAPSSAKHKSCYGSKCFHWTFVMCLSLASVVTLTQIINCLFSIRIHKQKN